MISLKRKRSGSINLQLLDNLNISDESRHPKKKKSEDSDYLSKASTEVSNSENNNKVNKSNESNDSNSNKKDKKVNNEKNLHFTYHNQDYGNWNTNLENYLQRPIYCPDFYKNNFDLNKQFLPTHLNHIILKKKENNNIIVISTTKRVYQKNVKFLYYSVCKKK
jgi:hypothetical protein